MEDTVGSQGADLSCMACLHGVSAVPQDSHDTPLISQHCNLQHSSCQPSPLVGRDVLQLNFVSKRPQRTGPSDVVPKGPFRTENALALEIVVFYYPYRFAAILPLGKQPLWTLFYHYGYRHSDLLSQ